MEIGLRETYLLTARIASELDAGRKALEPTPMRVSELAGSRGGMRPALATLSRSSIWPSTNEVSSSICCPARRPPSPDGCPLPGAGIASFSRTASVSSTP